MSSFDTAIELLTSLGWKHIGIQPVQKFRTYTGGSPVPNAEIKTGGRHKLCRDGSIKRVTVGKRTACFFDYEAGECKNFVSVSVKNIDEIKRLGAAV